MSMQREEVIDEFAPASVGIEEGDYLFTYERAFSTTGQYGEQNVHTLRFAELEGETIRVYTDPKMSKGSKQRQLIEAFIGRELSEGEQVTPRMLKGRQAHGTVEFNKNGRPAVAKLRRIRTAPTTPEAAAPAPTPIAAAPRRPAPPAVARVASAEQTAKLVELGGKAGLDGDALSAWIAENYTGKAILTVTPDEADALIEALGVPF